MSLFLANLRQSGNKVVLLWERIASPETWLQKLLMQSPRFGMEIDSLLWIWSLVDWQVLTLVVLPFFHDHFHFSTDVRILVDKLCGRVCMWNTEEFLQDSPLLMLLCSSYWTTPNIRATVKRWPHLWTWTIHEQDLRNPSR